MKMSKNDVRKILSLCKKYNENEINYYFKNPDKSEYKNILNELKNYNNPLELVKKIANKYNFIKGGSCTKPQCRLLPPYSSEKNTYIINDIFKNLDIFLTGLNNENLNNVFEKLNDNKLLVKKLKYFIGFNIGIIEAEIGIHDNKRLNFLVKILDDFSRNSNEIINENIYIIFYLGIIFLISKYDYSIENLINDIKVKFYNYLDSNKEVLDSKINSYMFKKSNEDIFTLKEGNFDDSHFIDFLKMLFNELPKDLILSLKKFIHDYNFIINNSNRDFSILNNLLEK